MQEKVTSVAAASVAVDLQYNMACNNPITIDGEDLEDVKIFTYLDSMIDEHSGSYANVKGTDQESKNSIFTTEEHLELKTTTNQH
ncbi:unnamed protein product [Schistosoma margrebowiei]|uniref:Uncharacterized protein n=1 Tax=Schistosoma margrebowiei TaxID=48269 RepID=A0A183LH55_9TREM|nr:unnamed protein product [Schistosoma margrebowiei]